VIERPPRVPSKGLPSYAPIDLVGDTPLVELRRIEAPAGVRLFAKLEGHNPSGSVKDRIARRLVLDAEERGVLRPGMTLIEASTGNTGIALTMVARQRGYRVIIVLPEGVVPAIPQILRTLGAELVWCPPDAGTRGAIETAERLARERDDAWAVQQFKQPLNVETHYATTGAEIVRDLDRIDVFVAGIGTGGTLMGAGRRVREAFPRARIVGLEPHLGEYLQGLRSLDDSFQPPLLDLSQLNGRWIVTAAESLRAAKLVAEREGILVGVSSGAALHVGLKEAARLPGGGNVVMMFADSGWKYLPAQPWEAATRGEAGLDEVHWW